MATAETILDPEGVTDLLAVASAGVPAGWVAVTNTAGAKARGKLPAVGQRQDGYRGGRRRHPGVEGQHRSAAAYQHAGTEVLLGQLPYPVTADQGKDLRDWVLEGHKLADMPTVAVSAEEAVAWGKKTRSASDRPQFVPGPGPGEDNRGGMARRPKSQQSRTPFPLWRQPMPYRKG